MLASSPARMTMDRNDLHTAIYARIDELPSLPVVVPRILALVEDPDADAGDLTAAIGHDPALTATLLKVANSAYYGFRREVDTLDRAVALLGFQMVRSLAVSAGVARSLPPGAGVGGFTREALWVHSAAVAASARSLARTRRVGDEGVWFLAGLLHDLGKVVFEVFFPEPFAAALARAAGGGEDLYRVERELIGADHGEAGGMLLERWNFPETIRDAVACHHEPPVGRPDPAGAEFVRDADAAARAVGLAAGNPGRPDGADDPVLAAVAEELARSKEGLVAFAAAVGG